MGARIIWREDGSIEKVVECEGPDPTDFWKRHIVFLWLNRTAQRRIKFKALKKKYLEKENCPDFCNFAQMDRPGNHSNIFKILILE